MAMADAERYQPGSLQDWHEWLAANHRRRVGVWVVQWRAASGNRPLPYEDMVREALCWGWIDGQVKTLDERHALQWWSPRKPGSGWAATNKVRVADLEREGRLQPAGIEAIDQAKANGMWTVLDSVEALVEPVELAEALDADPAARTAWNAFPRSVRKQALASIAFAKRPETRANRIATILEKSANGVRPA